jgi:polyphosphate kinase 2 (PPK2 family)
MSSDPSTAGNGGTIKVTTERLRSRIFPVVAFPKVF